jgi:hypothetical protein
MKRKSTQTTSPKRNHRWFLAIAGAMLTLLVLAPSAHADRKIFAYAYPYMTLPKGAFEMEHYLDAKFEKIDDPDTVEKDELYRPEWKHSIELEYGISDHWDFGFYNVFEQKPFSPMEYKGVKIRTRYRFGEQGDLFLDPGVYLEAFYYGPEEVGLEERVILGKVIKKFEASLNLKFEQKWKTEINETETELEFLPLLGIGYHLTRWFSVGAEYYGKLAYEVEEEEMEDYLQYVGPSLSFAGNNFWWTLAFQPQVSSVTEKHDYQARSVFAIVF